MGRFRHARVKNTNVRIKINIEHAIAVRSEEAGSIPVAAKESDNCPIT